MTEQKVRVDPDVLTVTAVARGPQSLTVTRAAESRAAAMKDRAEHPAEDRTRNGFVKRDEESSGDH